MLVIDFDEEPIYQNLKKLNTNKCEGLDGINPRILKELAAQVTRPLSLIFMASIDTGKYLSIWKKAIITPIFKKCEKQILIN